MKKITSFVLTLIMIFSLVSCAKVELAETTEQGSTAETETKETTMNEKETEKVETSEKKTGEEAPKKTEEPVYVDGIAPLPDIPSKLKHDISYYEKNATSFAKKTKIKDCILFTGASIIYRWREKPDNASMVVAGKEKALINAIRAKDGKQICINNGFGGSTMYEVAYYYKQMIQVFNPKVLVVSGIGNDETVGYTPSEVMQYIAWIANQATADRPDIQIYFTDFKPTMNTFGSAVREWIAELNGMLEEYEKQHSNFHIIKISEWPFFYNDPADIGKYQNINPAVFCGDKVHLSELGYEYYNEYFKKILDPYL